ADQFSSQRRKPIELPIGPAVFDGHVLTLDIAGLLQALMKFGQTSHRKHRRGCRAEIPDHRHRRLLRARRQRPRGSHAGDERDEVAPVVHSITSSAATSSLSGTVRPSILAVWWLMTSSNLLACTTGRSAGVAPLRMRPA